MSERDCNRCLYATRDGGCASWDCNFISIAEAEQALVRAEMSLPQYLDDDHIVKHENDMVTMNYNTYQDLLEPKRGRWIEKKDFIYCSECGEGYDAIYKIDYRYCPNCGTRMEASDD